MSFAKELCNCLLNSFILMLFTMVVPSMNVFLPFHTASPYVLLPGTVSCWKNGSSFFGKLFTTGLGWLLCLLYTDIWWRCCDICFFLHFILGVLTWSKPVSCFWSYILSRWLFSIFLVSDFHICLTLLGLIFESEYLLRFICHPCHVLVCCFILLAFQPSF